MEHAVPWTQRNLLVNNSQGEQSDEALFEQSKKGISQATRQGVLVQMTDQNHHNAGYAVKHMLAQGLPSACSTLRSGTTGASKHDKTNFRLYALKSKVHSQGI